MVSRSRERSTESGSDKKFGEVAERSIAAGCKPAAFGLRRFEPSPPHQNLSAPWLERGCLFGGPVCMGGTPRFARRRDGGERDSGLARRSAKWRAFEGRRAWERVGGSNSVVESQPSKLLVAGSIPVSRSNLRSQADRRGLRRLSTDPVLYECATAEGSAHGDARSRRRVGRSASGASAEGL